MDVEISTSWTVVEFDLPRRRGGNRVTFSTPRCESPLSLGLGSDPRCLSIKVATLKLRRSELFNLRLDPLALDDLYRSSRDLTLQMHQLLRRYRWDPIAKSSERQLDTETRKTLAALGYL